MNFWVLIIIINKGRLEVLFLVSFPSQLRTNIFEYYLIACYSLLKFGVVVAKLLVDGSYSFLFCLFDDGRTLDSWRWDLFFRWCSPYRSFLDFTIFFVYILNRMLLHPFALDFFRFVYRHFFTDAFLMWNFRLFLFFLIPRYLGLLGYLVLLHCFIILFFFFWDLFTLFLNWWGLFFLTCLTLFLAFFSFHLVFCTVL